MENIKWAVVGILLFVGTAVGTYFYGRTQCPSCTDFEKAEVLSELLVPTQKLILTEQNAVLKYDWQLYSTWPNLATFFSQLGFRKNAGGYVQYGAKYYYGYDLRNRSGWKLRKDGAQFVFEAPPLRMMTCPSVLSQSIVVTTNVGSIFVDEAGREKEVVRVTTAQALAAGHDMLRNPEQLQKIKAGADLELRQLLVSLARSLGWQVHLGDIKIVNGSASIEVPEPWLPRTGTDGTLDEPTVNQLKAAGCGGVLEAQKNL